MQHTDDLSLDQIRELLFSPLSDDEVSQIRESREARKGLLAFNLREMEREDDFDARH